MRLERIEPGPAALSGTTENDMITDAVKKRFWAKVERRGPDDCWPWKARRRRRGYGAFWLDGRDVAAHRVALEIDGRAPRGRQLGLHTCDNPPCCNPAHLFPGTQRDNVRDRDEKGRRRGPRGSAHHWARTPAARVLEIRRLASTGVDVATIASTLSMPAGTVRHIVNHETWKEIA